MLVIGAASLVQIADSIEVRFPSDGEPAGCVACVDAPVPGLVELNTAYSSAFEYDLTGSATSLAWYESTADERANLVLTWTRADLDDAAAVVRWFDRGATIVQIDGRPGWTGHVSALPSQPPQLPTIVWSPSTGVVASLTAVAAEMDQDDVIQLAMTVAPESR